MRHDPGLAASPPVRYILKVEGSACSPCPAASSAAESGSVTSRKPAATRLPGMAGKLPFEVIVSAHRGAGLRVCRAILSPADADDAWSETFLSALKAYPDLPADANIEAWLVTIAHRKAIDVTRAAARRPVPVAETPEPAAGARPGGPAQPEPDEIADLTVALAQLPAKQKQAVAYHYLAGLPYAEVAAILGGSTDPAPPAAAHGIAAPRRARPPPPPPRPPVPGARGAGGPRAGRWLAPSGPVAGPERAGGTSLSLL